MDEQKYILNDNSGFRKVDLNDLNTELRVGVLYAVPSGMYDLLLDGDKHLEQFLTCTKITAKYALVRQDVYLNEINRINNNILITNKETYKTIGGINRIDDYVQFWHLNNFVQTEF